MADTSITGGCYCGAIRYEAATPPYAVLHCHCVDCRRSVGAAFVTWASFLRDDFRIVQGGPREYVSEGRVRSFCARCGSSLTFLLGRDADSIDVTVSSFDDPTVVLPSGHTWLEDRLHWVTSADELPGHAQGTPDPAG